MLSLIYILFSQMTYAGPSSGDPLIDARYSPIRQHQCTKIGQIDLIRKILLEDLGAIKSALNLPISQVTLATGHQFMDQKLAILVDQSLGEIADGKALAAQFREIKIQYIYDLEVSEIYKLESLESNFDQDDEIYESNILPFFTRTAQNYSTHTEIYLIKKMKYAIIFSSWNKFNKIIFCYEEFLEEELNKSQKQGNAIISQLQSSQNLLRQNNDSLSYEDIFNTEEDQSLEFYKKNLRLHFFSLSNDDQEKKLGQAAKFLGLASLAGTGILTLSNAKWAGRILGILGGLVMWNSVNADEHIEFYLDDPENIRNLIHKGKREFYGNLLTTPGLSSLLDFLSH